MGRRSGPAPRWAGNVQPAPDDPSIASKRTYWEANGQLTRTIKIA